ncbi:putative methyltransferase C9orf114 [Dichanthelium oligosanthes]|uniref:Putative methyltransferase C9orf114 n=1 Tax=Dichanthelium oligosanthes TaxID=888268 RepID=A0A1E5WH53_9POAL|nr:putative methyltransferase C9orf114 [Dichanthelium oligosanthes]
MNPADSEAAAGEKARRKDKKQKRKKSKDAMKDDCGAMTAGEGAPHEKKQQKQRKVGGKGEEKKMLKPTVSIAVAGSIIDNAQSLELATLLAGQIARAATVFRIDEVVVFDSTPALENGSAGDGEESGARFLVRILEYLETPQYLRRRLFPMHKNLKYVGLLPPLDAPHHVRKHEWSEFREGYISPGAVGVTLEGDRSKGTLVDVGLSKNVLVEQILEPGKRVTVAMGTNRDLTTACVRKVVPPSIPREEMGSYWGYKVRYASNLSGVLKNSPYKGKHANDVFTSYLNTCPNQGSRTIRTEEALLISLQYFQDPIRRVEQQM